MNADQTISTSLFPGNPLLGDTLDNPREADALVRGISRALSSAVYMPLVYQTCLNHGPLLATQAVSWGRLPSPSLCISSLRAGLLARATERVGSRAKRRARRFANSGVRIRTVPGPSAMDDVLAIEAVSWKGRLGHCMRSRGQASTYRGLASSPNAQVRIAYDGDQPIAYRFDMRCGRTVSVLKWSFDESAARLSPGFYMLVCDLQDCWAGRDIDRIDLHGSPDTLKDSICDPDGLIQRTDFAWPNGCSALQRLAAERKSHDERIRHAWQSGTSTRLIYEPHRSAHGSDHPGAGSV